MLVAVVGVILVVVVFKVSSDPDDQDNKALQQGVGYCFTVGSK